MTLSTTVHTSATVQEEPPLAKWEINLAKRIQKKAKANKMTEKIIALTIGGHDLENKWVYDSLRLSIGFLAVRGHLDALKKMIYGDVLRYKPTFQDLKKDLTRLLG